jgi:hypothetical protein
MPSKAEVEENQKLLWEIGSRLHSTIMTALFIKDGHSWQRLEELLAWTEGKSRVKS